MPDAIPEDYMSSDGVSSDEDSSDEDPSDGIQWHEWIQWNEISSDPIGFDETPKC